MFQAYQGSFKVTPPGNFVGAYDINIHFYPHPIIWAVAYLEDHNGNHFWQTFLNPSLSGPAQDYVTAYSALTTVCSQYRIGYLGVTGYHDAPATANQGLVAVAQYSERPFRAALFSNQLTQGYQAPCEVWPDAARGFGDLQTMPNSYLGNARDGFYSPYKLSRNFNDWRASAEACAYVNQAALVNHPGFGTDPQVQTTPPLPDASIGNWPYAMAATYVDGQGVPTSWMVHPRADYQIIHAFATGLDNASSYTFYIRTGYEYQVLPSSPLVSNQTISPACDATALASYFAVSRELRDAYPADYNDLGKILEEIGEIASDVIGTVFPIAKPIFSAGRAIYRALRRTPATNVTSGGGIQSGSSSSGSAGAEPQQQVAPRRRANTQARVQRSQPPPPPKGNPNKKKKKKNGKQK